ADVAGQALDRERADRVDAPAARGQGRPVGFGPDPDRADDPQTGDDDAAFGAEHEKVVGLHRKGKSGAGPAQARSRVELRRSRAARWARPRPRPAPGRGSGPWPGRGPRATVG